MYVDKKRGSISKDDRPASQTPAAASTSTFYTRRSSARPTMAHINTNNLYNNTNSPSPPATAYFSGFSEDPNARHEPTANPDAQAHFAYSTTLRRHHVDHAGHATPIRTDFFPDGLKNLTYQVTRMWDNWRAGGQEYLLENGWGEQDASRPSHTPKDGVSAQYASWSAEVSHFKLLSCFI